MRSKTAENVAVSSVSNSIWKHSENKNYDFMVLGKCESEIENEQRTSNI